MSKRVCASATARKMRCARRFLESASKSTLMVRAIATATLEQTKGLEAGDERDHAHRSPATVQQIALSTSEQANGSEQIMKSAERMKVITQHVERSSQEQNRGGKAGDQLDRKNQPDG